MARTTRYTESELNIRDYVEYAKSHVGEVHDVMYQTKHSVAGQYEIIDFIESDEPKFEYDFWMHKDAEEPDSAEVGYYIIRFKDTKFYNNRTLTFKVTAYVQFEEYGTNKVFKTKAIYISNVPEEIHKTLKAYEFGILDWRVRA